MNHNLLVKALINKYRFESDRGSLTVEDLFQISKTSLNKIAKAIHKQILEEGEVDFIGNGQAKTSKLQEQLDIVVYAINLRLEMEKEATQNAQLQSEIKILEEALETSKKAALTKASPAELATRIAQLKARQR